MIFLDIFIPHLFFVIALTISSKSSAPDVKLAIVDPLQKDSEGMSKKSAKNQGGWKVFNQEE